MKNSRWLAFVATDDAYLQRNLLTALKPYTHKRSTCKLITQNSTEVCSQRDFSSIATLQPSLVIWPYENLPFQAALDGPRWHYLLCAYTIRKALIRKNFLSETLDYWIAKHPSSLLTQFSVRDGFGLELDYAEFLDEALMRAGVWHIFCDTSAEQPAIRNDKWWILKPSLVDGGRGIRLFNSLSHLTRIFEAWDNDYSSNDEESSISKQHSPELILTSQLRQFTIQPYLHPPLLFKEPLCIAGRKFHLRVYILAVGALTVYVYPRMLTLFASTEYKAPWESFGTKGLKIFNENNGLQCTDNIENINLDPHITNSCRQMAPQVWEWWNLPDEAFTSHCTTVDPSENCVSPDCIAAGLNGGHKNWKFRILHEIIATVSEMFRAVVGGTAVHFQPRETSFEVFGLDFLIVDGEAYPSSSIEKTCDPAGLRPVLLEVNAYPDFSQTGERLQDIVENFWKEVVRVAIKPWIEFHENDTNLTSQNLKIYVGQDMDNEVYSNNKSIDRESIPFEKCIERDKLFKCFNMKYNFD